MPTDYKHRAWEQAAGPTAFVLFPMDTDYFGSREQSWMMNFRARNNGRFARLHDPDGNPIELWEPASTP